MNADLIRRLRALVIMDDVGSDNPLGRDAADALEYYEQRLHDVTLETVRWSDRAMAAEAEVARLRGALSKRKMVMGDDGVPHLMTCEKCGENVGTDALSPTSGNV